MSTLTQLITRVRTDMDLLDEPAVTDTEITQKLNEGIDIVEAAIQELYEDYFLKRGTAINLVSGTSEYSYPNDIWGNKIRALVYRNGSIVKEIPRFDGNSLNTFEATESAEALASWSYDNMTYRPMNSVFRISPVPSASQTAVLIPWYIRQATALTVGADSCDVPEWEHVVTAYAKKAIAENKAGLGDPAALKAAFEDLEARMRNSLSNRVPDQWDLVAQDTSIYQEHS